jgi:hypothetical protein
VSDNLKSVAILALLVILGFGLRFSQLGAIGFAEDEINKLDAIHAYERGDSKRVTQPHDEFYDDGLREAIKYVCEQAPVGATIAHETPGVARHYLSAFGREDLQSRVISSKEFDMRTAPWRCLLTNKSFSRKGAKAQRKTFGSPEGLPLRLCAFA